jgi:hypothetical protein
MIITDITGRTTGEADGMLALIKLVSEPDAYREKVKALMEATEEHKRFVALVGPADDVLNLQAAAKADRETAKTDLAAAQASANKIRLDAKEQGRTVVDKAQAESNDLLAQARSTLASAEAMRADVNRKAQELDQVALKLIAEQKAVAQQSAQLLAAAQKLDAEQAEAESLRDALRKKLAQIAQAADL